MNQPYSILIITPQLPYPLTSGGAQAQFNMIDELRHQHHITLLFTEDRNNRRKNMRQLQTLWPNVTIIPYPYILQAIYPQFLFNKIKRGLQTILCPHSTTFLVDRAIRPICIYYSRLLKWFITRLIRKQNIQIVQTEFYPAIGLVRLLPSFVKTVFIQHEINYIKNERYLSSLQLSQKQLLTAKQARQYEIECMNAYDTVITLTEVDKHILIQDGVATFIYVSPAGIKAQLQEFQPFTQQLCFVGSNQHLPNREGFDWLKDKVFPLISDKLTCNIIGIGWQQYTAVNNVSIQSCGFVESISQFMAGSIMVVPILSGSGMRMKILEAAAASVPFITTSVGVEGLDFEHNHSCLIADTPEEFAQAIHTLANDETLQQRLANNAHNIYLAHYTTKYLAQKRNLIYKI